MLASPAPNFPAVSWWLRAPGCGEWVLGLVRVIWVAFVPLSPCPLHQALAPRTPRPPGSSAECHGVLCTSSESQKNNYQPIRDSTEELTKLPG